MRVAMRRLRCRYPRHVGDTSERTPCHGVTVAAQDLPARGVAVDARESEDKAAFGRRVRHLSQCWEAARATGKLIHCRQAGTPRV